METCSAAPALDPFAGALARSGVELRRGVTTTLQVNVGLLCKIFFAAIAVWFLFLVLTDSSSCSGPVRFRPR